MKSGLSEVKDKMDDIRMGQVHSRGSGESCDVVADVRCNEGETKAECFRLSVSSGDLMMAESMFNLRASSANLRRSQWTLRGQ